MPVLLVLIFPYGPEIGAEKRFSLVLTAILMIIFGLLGKAIPVQRKPRFIINQQRLVAVINFLFLLCAAINLYIYFNLGFRWVMVDIKLRSEMYIIAGRSWTILVSFLSVASSLLGLIKAREVPKVTWCLFTFNTVAFVGYGMKSSLLQIMVPFFVSYINQLIQINKLSQMKFKLLLINRIIVASVSILFCFWSINSLRAGRFYSILDFVEMVYLYIAPNFANFFNVTSEVFDFKIYFGGLFGGLYKFIGIMDNPLDLLDESYLEHITWNVWTFLATLYLSGGWTEVFVGSCAIGFYASYSSEYFSLNPYDLGGLMNFSQMLLLMVFLHNQYYYSSFAPVFSVVLCAFVQMCVQVKPARLPKGIISVI